MNGIDEVEFVYCEVYAACIYASHSEQNSKVKAEEAVADYKNAKNIGGVASLYIWTKVYAAEIWRGSIRMTALVAANIAVVNHSASFADSYDRRQ